jgi:hypothetical protein
MTVRWRWDRISILAVNAALWVMIWIVAYKVMHWLY